MIDNSTLEEYEKYYFKQHPRASKKPIENPYHPTINQWMIMKRPMMNALKKNGKISYVGLLITKVILTYTLKNVK